MSETNSRRDFLRHAAAGTAGMAVAAVPGIAAAADGAPDAMPPLARMRNPHDLYPRAPFARQVQPVPGLASKMVPRPDHGETSYRGSNRLAGRKALVTGGDSGIGRAAAIAFAREGADVAINYLPGRGSDAREVVALIRKEGRKCVAIPGDIRDRGLLPAAGRARPSPTSAASTSSSATWPATSRPMSRRSPGPAQLGAARGRPCRTNVYRAVLALRRRPCPICRPERRPSSTDHLGARAFLPSAPACSTTRPPRPPSSAFAHALRQAAVIAQGLARQRGGAGRRPGPRCSPAAASRPR